jgi:aldose 1-epimerase
MSADDEQTVTPINLTQHWGFNLDASLRSDGEAQTIRPEPDVKGHLLKIKVRICRPFSHSRSCFYADIFRHPRPTRRSPSTRTTTRPAHWHPPKEHTMTTPPVSPPLPLSPASQTDIGSQGKLIGDGWPDVDTGKGVGYDEFYAFSAPLTPPQVIVPESQLGADVDLVKGVITPGTTQTDEPVTELSSAKSGLKLSFFTNRASLLPRERLAGTHTGPFAQSPACNSTLPTSTIAPMRVRRSTAAAAR